MATSSKIRSACDVCHRTKVRCTGDIPCEGCVNSGNLCFYSYTGRLGRPKGTKSRKRKNNDNASSPGYPTDTEKDTGRQSPQNQHSRRSTDKDPSHQRSASASQSAFPMPESFATSMPPSASPSGLERTATSSRPPYPPIPDGRQFIFPDVFGPTEGETQNLLDPFLKDFVYMPQDFTNENLPISTGASPQTPLSLETSNRQSAAPGHKHQVEAKKVSHSSLNLFNSAAMACSCFQQNAELLCSLKLAEAGENKGAYKIDSFLRTATEALRPWQSLIDCRNCANNIDQEVLQISFMTIRIVLQRLQHLVPSGCSKIPGTRKSTVDGRPTPTEETEASWPNYNARVTLGVYEASEADNNMVIQVLLLGIVRKIKAMMIKFKEMLDRKQRMLPPKTDNGRTQKQWKNMAAEQGHPSSNLDHIQHMLQGLASFLQILERSLEKE
ncbi:MAG: hypothetical protein LQ352_007577 [Teloschistes flavicans]|nr:MAG: hypothetical protein LQ352_007577 [Teloschistes flavicans]